MKQSQTHQVNNRSIRVLEGTGTGKEIMPPGHLALLVTMTLMSEDKSSNPRAGA